MGPIDCAETSITIGLRYVTSQKSEDLSYTAAQAWITRQVLFEVQGLKIKLIKLQISRSC